MNFEDKHPLQYFILQNSINQFTISPMSDSSLSMSRGSSTRNSFGVCVDFSPSKGSLDSETDDEVECSRPRRFSTRESLQDEDSISKNLGRIHKDENELFGNKEYSELDVSYSISESSESFDESPRGKVLNQL